MARGRPHTLSDAEKLSTDVEEQPMLASIDIKEWLELQTENKQLRTAIERTLRRLDATRIDTAWIGASRRELRKALEGMQPESEDE